MDQLPVRMAIGRFHCADRISEDAAMSRLRYLKSLLQLAHRSRLTLRHFAIW